MKKILLLATVSFLLVQCNKKVELPELAKDNDYENFDLKDRICEVNQKVTILKNTNFSIDDKNTTYTFNNLGYLVNDSIYNNENVLMETNTYEKLKYPLTKKQFITKDNYILSQTIYDSLKNIVYTQKVTNKKQVIEQQKNTFSDNYIVREDYFTSASATPFKVVEIVRNGDVMKSKVIYSQNRKILDSIVYQYNMHDITKQTHYNANKQITSSELYSYDGKNIATVVYLNGQGKEEAVEKFGYNQKNEISYKYVFTAADNSIYEEINTYNKFNKIEKSETKLNGNVLTSIVYKYNENNDVASYEMKNYTNKEELTKSFTYTYDDKGNWITKDVSINKEPIYKVSRTLKYCNN